jgi:inward rectifier potassium channel
MFILSWTVMHPIDEHSPLYGATAASLAAGEVELVVGLTGIDETFAQTIHARHSYRADEILWNGRLADILDWTEDGRRRINYRRFHDVVPLEER